MSTKIPYAIYQRGELHYLGLHEDEADCWKVALGWPNPEEIAAAKRHGAMLCLPVRVMSFGTKGGGTK